MGAAADVDVHGMTCAGCVAAVERAVAAVDGVSDVTVSLVEHSARVNGTFRDQDVVKAIEQIGYSASIQAAGHVFAESAGSSASLASLWWRSLVAGIVGFPLMFAGMAGFLPGLDKFWFGFAIAALTLGVLVFSGSRYFVGAALSARHLRANMDTLIAIGTGTAWVYSVGVTFAPWAIVGAEPHTYFEAR